MRNGCKVMRKFVIKLWNPSRIFYIMLYFIILRKYILFNYVL